MKLVVDRIAECYRTGAQPTRPMSEIEHTVVHMTSLSRYEKGANERPITDSLADAPKLCSRFYQYPGIHGVPYHIFILKDGTAEQAAPLSVTTYHARSHNPTTIAVAVIGEGEWANAAQLDKLVQVCRALHPLARSLVGHMELPDASNDKKKTCPSPVVDMRSLRPTVMGGLPSGWQLGGKEAIEQSLVDAGFVI